MRHYQQTAWIIQKETFQDIQGHNIQIIRGLIQNQEVGVLD